MTIPYRARRILGRAAVILLVVILAVALVWGCWVVYLGRYVVYSDEGARLDFDRSSEDITGELAVPPEDEETVSIYYNEGENAVNASTELTQIVGYYISTAELKENMEAVRARVRELESGTAVMVEVKDGYGSFYYSSSVSDKREPAIDTEAMDALIDQLDKSGMYTIARVTALQDQAYGLNNVNDGLFSAYGAYLWQDEMNCYWLDPAREGVISYLVQIANELKQLGFDEVVFDEFYFPASANYTYSGDKYQVITDAAKTLVSTCAVDSFAVSFVGDSSFPLPEGRTRLYVTGVEAADVTSAADAIDVPDRAVNLVFLTDVHDTRFDVYSVLRPLDAA